MEGFMLIPASSLMDYSIIGIDDYVGRLQDLYMDDWQWIVRYLVVEATENLESVKYLISPFSLGKTDLQSKEITVALTLHKIKNSPVFQTDLPISRQYELALRRYYEWPDYWEQTSFTGPPPAGISQNEELNLDEVGKPVKKQSLPPDSEDIFSDTSENIIPDEPDDLEIAEAEFGLPEEEIQFNTELRSFQELRGYRIQTTDNDISALEDLFIEEPDWNSKYLMINLHNSSEDQMVLLTFHFVQQIDWGSKRIFVSLSQQQLQNAPRYIPGDPISLDFEKKVYAYFDSL